MWKIQKGSECVSKTFRIPVEICSALESLATQNNLSLNALVVQSLRYALDNLEKPKDTSEK